VSIPWATAHLNLMIRGFDNEQYQSRIDARVGLNKDGKSILKLSYAPEVMTWVLGEVVPRYWITRRKEQDAWKYEQPDAWVIEKRLEREVYWDAHEATRYQVIDATDELVDLGPPPEDFYIFDTALVVHSNFHGESGLPECCEKAWEGEERYTFNSRMELVKTKVSGRRRCWGEYREPNDSDLAMIERAVRKMNSDPYYSPYMKMSPEQLIACEVEANLDAQRIAEEANNREQELSRDFDYTHGWRQFETSAKKLAHGRYHFLGNAWKAGKHGLALPD
jgi:hypothetical protein